MKFMYEFLKTLTPNTMLWVRATFPLLGCFLGTAVDRRALWLLAATDAVAALLELSSKFNAMIVIAIFAVGNVAAVMLSVFSGKIDGEKAWPKIRRAILAIATAFVVAVSICLIETLIVG